MLIHELFYKDPYVVPEEAHIIILDRKLFLWIRMVRTPIIIGTLLDE